MKKKLLVSLMTAILSVSMFAGCSKSDSGTSGEVVTELTQPVEITMWHYMNGKQAETLNSIIDDFNATNGKNITVKAVAQGSINDLNKKVVTASTANSLPAIINVYPDAATTLIEEGKIADLTPYVEDAKVGMKDDLTNDFVTNFVEELSQWGENKIYGLPMTKSTEVLYVNKTLLEQLGYTLDDMKNLTMEKLVEISKKAKEELGIPGFGFDSSSNAFISTLKMDGVDFIEEDKTINCDNEWVRQFMNYYKELTEAGVFRIPGEEKFLSNAFSNGRLLTYQGSSAGYAHINTDGKYEVVAVEVPVFEGKEKAVIQQGASLFVTTDVSPEEQYAAYEFLKFATNTENTAKFSLATGYLPVRKSAMELDSVKAAVNDDSSLFGKIYKVSQDSLNFAYYTPAINNAQSARQIASEKYDAYVTGNDTDLNKLLEDMKNEIETVINY